MKKWIVATREIIFFDKGENCHRRGIPPIREAEKNYIIIFHIIK